MAPRSTILVVDDEEALLEVVCDALARDDRLLYAYTSPLKALQETENHRLDLVLTDLYMPEIDGLELLRRLKARDPDTEVVLLTAYGDVEKAVRAMKQGAADFLIKPVRLPELVMTVGKLLEFRALRRRLKELSGGGIAPVGSGPALTRVLEAARTVAETPTNILIRGETGVGKEVLADYIQSRSDRADGPFVKVNCVALPESLLESELFGHEKGAFTGATEQRIGRFERAHKGVLFLDEIGEMTPAMQAKLLRVLETREIERIGGSQSLPVDFRLFCATNRDLEKMIAEGTFREDLYYRINVFTISIPPLRERPEDLPALVHHFLTRSRLKLGRGPTEVAPEAMSLLCRYSWPGNVRELENVIERSCVLARGSVLTPELLSRHTPKLTVAVTARVSVSAPPAGAVAAPATAATEKDSPPQTAPPPAATAPWEDTEKMPAVGEKEERAALAPLVPAAPAAPAAPPVPAAPAFLMPWDQGVENPLVEAERTTVKIVLERCGWNFAKAAEALKLSRSALYSKASKLGLKKSGRPRGF